MALDHKLHTRRLWNMLIGEQETKEGFKYLSKHGVRTIASIFFEKARDIDDLV